MNLIFGVLTAFVVCPAISFSLLEALLYLTGVVKLLPRSWQRNVESAALSRVPSNSSFQRRHQAALLLKTAADHQLELIATDFLVLLAEEAPGRQEVLFSKLVNELIFPPLPLARGKRDHAIALLARYAEAHGDHRYSQFLLEHIHDDVLRESCLAEHSYDLTPLTSD